MADTGKRECNVYTLQGKTSGWLTAQDGVVQDRAAASRFKGCKKAVARAEKWASKGAGRFYEVLWADESPTLQQWGSNA